MSDPLSSLMQNLLSSKLVTAEHLESVRSFLGSDSTNDGEAVLQALVKQDDITSWLADQLRKGNTAFYLDNDRYVIRPQIGQGGMGACRFSFWNLSKERTFRRS